LVFAGATASSEHEFINVSIAHINSPSDDGKGRRHSGRETMIILLIGVVGTAIYGWWTHRKTASGKSAKA
jgi:hypothetical protein